MFFARLLINASFSLTALKKSSSPVINICTFGRTLKDVTDAKKETPAKRKKSETVSKLPRERKKSISKLPKSNDIEKKEVIPAIDASNNVDHVNKKELLKLDSKEDLSSVKVLKVTKVRIKKLNKNGDIPIQSHGHGSTSSDVAVKTKFSSKEDTIDSLPLFVNSPLSNNNSNFNTVIPFPMVLEKVIETTATNEIITVSGSDSKVPSVTQVLSVTMPDSSAIALAMWRKRKIAEVGEEGFKEYMRDAKLTGKELHTGIETHLRGVGYNAVRIEPRISGHWLSLKSVFTSIVDVRVLESYIYHPHLKYKGFVDCVAHYKGELVVVDWKTSARRKNTLEATYDDPVQIAAYVGAMNADDRYPFKVENALLVVAYPTGMPADVITLNRQQCEHYWFMWIKRLQEFQTKRNEAKVGANISL